ncbi:MAG: ribosome silencing factor [Verrucomicrobia bacterium]|nr:ribosome silencing factor [Verrucomicrobiota bacterium]MBT7067887.1 ribosome silencing factor [Verrucomicrobiota bacterium]MBT7699353.1 ribosome silencing factor [Verrucomicrobiota bacterium]
MEASTHSEVPTGRALARRAVEILEDRKGENLLLIDVTDVSNLSDYVLLVNGSSPPHLKAMWNELQHTLKQEGVHAYRKSGMPDSGWMVLDYVDVVIHILSPEAREYYALEELWPEAPHLEC